MILFSVQVIHTSADVIDKDHAFSKGNFLALIITSMLSPLFGLSNDYAGIRVNSIIAMATLAVLGFFTSELEDYTSQNKFWYLFVAHTVINWQSTTIAFGCSHLFGIKCGIQALSYVKSATVVAAIISICFLPVLSSVKCFNDDLCEDRLSNVVSGLLLCCLLLSLILNPKPLVDEEKNQF